MLQGFEEHTAPLTDQEKKILPVIVRGLQKKKTVANAVTNRAICKGLLRTCRIEITEARVRKIINHIRMKNLVPGLVATSKGYYVSTNPHEVKKYIKSLEGRKNAIEGITNQFRMYLREITTMQPQRVF